MIIPNHYNVYVSLNINYISYQAHSDILYLNQYIDFHGWSLNLPFKLEPQNVKQLA